MDAIKASVLEKLIRELCPEGVEYRELSELFKTKNGYTPSKGNKEFWENGNIPWFRMDDIRQNGGILSRALQNVTEKAVKGEVFPENSLIVATSATIGEHALITVPSLANQRFTYLLLKEEYKNKFEMRFLYYYCFKLDEYCKSNLNQGNFASVDMGKFSKFKFPLPPLPIQQEIVRILDTFTNFTAELTDKLNAELTARRKQYEYYRDELLTFGEDTREVTLREVVKHSCSGGTPSKGNVEYYSNGNIPWIRTQDVRFNEISEVDSYITERAVEETSVKWIPKNCVIVAISGASAGRCAINKIEATTNQHCLNMEIDSEKALYKYVFYSICSKYQELLDKKQGARGDLNSKLILDTKIALPDLNVQKYIVNILDKFNVIISSLTSGIPAEISARQKQYEYYRDQMLSFQKEKE